MAHIQGSYNDVQESPLEAGIRQYYEAKNQQDAKKLQQQQLQMGLLSHGLVQDPTGNITRDPVEDQMRQAQLQQATDAPQIGLLKAHIERNPDSGSLGFTPEEQQRQALDTKYKQAQINYMGQKGQAAVGGAQNKDQEKTYADTLRQLEQMRGNPAVQQAEKDLYAGQKAQGLISLYPDPNKLSPQQLNLLSQEVGKIAAGGVPTQHELEGISPNTFRGQLAGITQKFTNAPSPANAAAFIQQYKDYLNTLNKDAEGVINERYGRIINPRKGHLKQSDLQSIQDEYMNRFGVKAPDDNSMTAQAPAQGLTGSKKPKSVMQNGHTYILNEATGEYE